MKRGCWGVLLILAAALWAAPAVPATAGPDVLLCACQGSNPVGPGIYRAHGDLASPAGLTAATPNEATGSIFPPPGRGCEVAAVSRDGRFVAVSRNGYLFAADTAAFLTSPGTALKPIADPSGTQVYGWGPAWSPEGGRLALHSANVGLAVVNRDGGDYRQLLKWPTDGGEIREPEWSPDGKAMVFRMGRAEASHLYLLTGLDSDSEPVLQQLTSDAAYTECWPQWSPDGRQIAFTRGPAGERGGGRGADLWVVTVATKEARRLTKTADRQETARGWNSSDGCIYYTEASGQETAAVARMKPDGSEAVRLGGAMAPAGRIYWLAAGPAPRVEESPVMQAAGNGPVLASAPVVPKIVFDETTWKIGEIGQNQQVAHRFAFRNGGGATLTVAGATTSCSCTAAVLGLKEIPPGQGSSVDATFDSQQYHGPVTKEITVTSDDPTSPELTLTVEAKVVVDAEADPRGVYLGRLDIGEVAERTIVIRRVDAPRLGITKIETDHPALRVERSGPDAEGSYTLKLVAGPFTEAGKFTGKVVVTTDLTWTPRIEVAVYGRIGPAGGGSGEGR
jgi:hypothetical protein